ncbi:hypothetical protein BDV96DRAFT_654937 [Lophiotrema nucula]|uniref:N-acetyltransferase domain-containing protein n=1 Tax=Lophiotrema nucula TaxID=690887 RepID=A0A6A5YGZ3_9PLEO|nr:hypothetical protein BDV96DRAFT_654937 [Lophiotrema nucula]
MIEGYSIHPVTEPDLPTLTQFLLDAKLGLAVNRFLFRDWPNYEAQRRNYGAAIENGFYRNEESEMVKVVEDASGRGEVVAHLVWNHKKVKEEKGEEQIGEDGGQEEKDDVMGERQVPEGMVPEVFHMVVEGVRELAGVKKGVEHIELTHIYVLPQHRQKGIGTALVELVKQKAKEKGLPVLMGSEPQAKRLFETCGFEETGFVDWDLRRFAKENCG